MERMITFRKLKDICCWDKVSFGNTYCCHEDYGSLGSRCTKKNCPVWRKLRRVMKKNKCTACNGYGFVFTKELEKHTCDVCAGDGFY